MRKLIFGKHYTGIVKVPFMNCNRFRMNFSTRNNNIIIKGLDGVITNYTTKKNRDFTVDANGTVFQITTSTTYTGDLEITTLGGNSDVYSIGYSWANSAGNDRFNIQDLGLFYEQFPNLYSIYYEIHAYNDALRQPTLKGNLIKFGNSVRRCRIKVLDILNRTSNAFVNLNEINSNSQLEWFYHNSVYAVNYSGDLANLPQNIYYFVAGALNTSTLTYTAGRVWSSSFDTLNLGNAKLSETDTDNLFIDLNNSITTAIGSKIINLANCYRSATSDSAVAGLQAKGFTILILGKTANPNSKILDLPLQNSFTDVSDQAMSIIAGNANGLPSFVAGPKGTDYAVNFDGTKSLKTALNLAINTSDKVSISFWMKTTQTANGGLLETSADAYVNNAIKSTINEFAANKIAILDHNTTGFNIGSSTTTINNGNWHHVVMIIDRSLGVTQNSIYVNKVLGFTQRSDFKVDNSGNFADAILTIGQTARNIGFTGQLAYLKIFNYPLSQTEIDNFYNI